MALGLGQQTTPLNAAATVAQAVLDLDVGPHRPDALDPAAERFLIALVHRIDAVADQLTSGVDLEALAHREIDKLNKRDLEQAATNLNPERVVRSTDPAGQQRETGSTKDCLLAVAVPILAELARRIGATS